MTGTDVEIHPCGSGAAHVPHPSRTLARWWCPGIMPLWPCGLRNQHLGHEVPARNFYCPGSVDPPRNLTGPRYPHDDVLAAVDTVWFMGGHMERAVND